MERVFGWQHNRCTGSFVELGAWDGLFGSNTARFERQGWRGLCIEPDPSNFRLLTQNRPSCVNVNALASDRVGKATYVQTTNQGFNGLQKFLDMSKLQEAGVKVVSRLKVPTVPLSHLLARHEMWHVDLLSLDVEGAEMVVLRSIDFGNFTFGAMLIEVGPQGARPPMLRLLASHGYRLLGMVDAHDALWVNSCLYGVF